MTPKRVRINISGRVQGVFFRYHTRETALKLGVKGCVRNTQDGGVEVIAEGPAEKIDELIKWCRHGPPSAKVADITIEFEELTGESSPFQIRY